MAEQYIDDRQPVLSMMAKPRETFHYAIHEKTFSHSLYIGAIGGFSNALLGLFQTKYPFGYQLFDVVYSSFITGVIFYLLTCFVTGYLLKVIGGKFGSKATFKELFQTLCLITIPYIWLLPILLFWMQLSPDTFFKVNVMNLNLEQGIIVAFGVLAISVTSIWTFVLTLVGLSEVMKVSKWKAFGIMFLASFIAAIIMLAITALF